MNQERCSQCGGSRCEPGECEPCMHGDCPDRCIDDICRGSGNHMDCRCCEGSGWVDVNIGDTCCGNCAPGRCYVDQLTGA